MRHRASNRSSSTLRRRASRATKSRWWSRFTLRSTPPRLRLRSTPAAALLQAQLYGADVIEIGADVAARLGVHGCDQRAGHDDLTGVQVVVVRRQGVGDPGDGF